MIISISDAIRLTIRNSSRIAVIPCPVSIFPSLLNALLAAVVLFYQAAGTLGEWALTGSFHAAVQDFRIGLPGMLLQIFGGWAFINFIIRK